MQRKPTKEQQLKILKKEREEKLSELKEWNQREFKRLDQAKLAYVKHWEGMVDFLTA